ncbi:hypothetical protein CLAFUW4_11995 [Fulvia fulva]|uniref:uncharacterized protein n=1 Tax=Passalora fulva TaxID=5499 RepID=UPI0004E9B710|nr:uncharacterized protein CLAFUR5_20326 [Fulvia fulva]KAK4617883.1 hypothetical protein CLAFUR4_12000 [Fulvia fulva]KAK4618674.1 hypothetical protein CLAFUR0_12011 [Fulvia fulva]WMI38975.1 hypothetical protein CLAFUR5_20326 [Fulvia fulva]WPV18409.1 hypothetical protein CLAFUW4_11995 [Fulvia fulva]WPV33488.1 hypothetical protein CLAFUW7_12002 [Fulvia fulva]
MEDQQARLSAIRQTNTPEPHGEEVNPEEPATQESDAVVDEFFDGDAFERDQEARAEGQNN